MKRLVRGLPVVLLLILVGLAPHAQPAVSASDDAWRARYYNNRDLSGDPVLVRNEDAIDYDWGDGSPSGSVDSDDFSARWTRTITIGSPGVYRFAATMDDGMRVWVNGGLIIDEWNDSQVRTVTIDVPLTAGEQELEVRYYEAGGKAVAKLSYGPVQGPPSAPLNRWQGRYWNNQQLAGAPAFVRSDGAIDFNWKLGSPWPTIQNDHFSARWTGSFDHTPGRYRFTVVTDDGVRLWVNDQLLIDAWHVNQSQTYTADVALPGGSVPIRVDYFENEGAALITVRAEQITDFGSGRPTPVPVPTAAPGLPPGQTAVVTGANWLSLRSSPEIADNIITALPRGQVVQMLGRNGGWIKVRPPGGLEGWVGSSYLAAGVPFGSLPIVD